MAKIGMMWYKEYRKAWYFHHSSWYMRHDNGCDGKGCTGDGCVPECSFYNSNPTLEEAKAVLLAVLPDGVNLLKSLEV